MGNGVSGKVSGNLKAIYLDVDGRKHKVIGKFKLSFCRFLLFFLFSLSVLHSTSIQQIQF